MRPFATVALIGDKACERCGIVVSSPQQGSCTVRLSSEVTSPVADCEVAQPMALNRSPLRFPPQVAAPIQSG